MPYFTTCALVDYHWKLIKRENTTGTHHTQVYTPQVIVSFMWVNYRQSRKRIFHYKNISEFDWEMYLLHGFGNGANFVSWATIYVTGAQGAKTGKH